MILLLYIVLGLFGVKLFYNISIPYKLLKKQDVTMGISVMVVVEWLLLVAALILSFLVEPEATWLRFWPLCGIGIAAILATYVNFAMTMILGGWYINRKK